MVIYSTLQWESFKWVNKSRWMGGFYSPNMCTSHQFWPCTWDGCTCTYMYMSRICWKSWVFHLILSQHIPNMPECQKGTSQLRSVVESATPPKRPSPSSSRARNKSYLQKLLPAETGAYATLTFGQWIPYIETYTYFTQYITILTIYMNKKCIHYIYVYIYTHTFIPIIMIYHHIS